MPAILTGLLTTLPATCTLPLNGNCSPVASFIRVDLPQPDGPTTAANSPRFTWIERPSTASVPPAPP
jgi:hypothetical protein